MVADTATPTGDDDSSCCSSDHKNLKIPASAMSESEFFHLSMKKKNNNSFDVPSLEISDVESQLSAVESCDGDAENGCADQRHDGNATSRVWHDGSRVTSLSIDSNDDAGIAISLVDDPHEGVTAAPADRATMPIPSAQRISAEQETNQITPAAEAATTAATDQSYTVSWSSIARGEKWCGVVMPRFTWLSVLIVLLAILCASIGYILHSLRSQA